MIRNDTIWGTVKCGIAECGMAIGLGLDLGPGVRVRVMAGHGLRSGLGLYFGPYPGIAPGGYSIHYTNTNPNPYPGANPG